MSLILTLKIIPEHTKWVGTATIEEDSKDRHTQKELAMRLQLTGEEVTTTLADLDFKPFGARYSWADYQTTVEKSNRDVCLLKLKGITANLLNYLTSKKVDVYVKVTNIHDIKSLGWTSSKTADVFVGISEWQG